MRARSLESEFDSSRASKESTNRYVGVIGATAIHLQDRARDAKVRKLHELFIDIGCTIEGRGRGED